MHMADALISAPVAGAAGVAAATLIVIAGIRVKRCADKRIVPLMGVMGAFIFAAQMINFTIPGTGSSGHVIGGVLLAALLGPWAAFLTLVSVLLIQCLIFADGGLMALGCNIINMAAMSCLVAYPLVMKPLLRFPASPVRILCVSVLACVVALEAGACLVVGETVAGGITALPSGKFLMFMTPIHFVIGIGEGLATAAVICFIQRTRPDLLHTDARVENKSMKSVLVWFAAAAVILGGGIAYLASENPDGLEWSVEKVAGVSEIESDNDSPIAAEMAAAQSKTALMPDYDHSLAGILGAAMTMTLLWALTSLIVRSRRKSPVK
ncbi:MAG: energy-coupling factor ABC transporter permease [Paramuribaculum sp.]|nr:energy-coupling factor ABC transporter permease [Paramuribaculum sp.]